MSTDIELGELPAELADRVRAATAHADYRSIHRSDDGYAVYAMAGDRVVLMQLALGENNSVAETTETILRSDVALTTVHGDAGVLEVTDGDERRRVSVPPELARLLAG